MPFADVGYQPGDVLMFGPEPTGLDEVTLADPHVTARVRIPMLAGRRSLNLANAAAVVVYEAWRQHGFAGGVASPAVPVHDLVERQPLGRAEIGSFGVRDREQPALAVLLKGMPRRSAACFSPSPRRCSVVYAEPSPRERNASM